MRGRPHDPAVARAKARAHAKRHYVCLSCGRYVRGNGGRSSHMAAHARRGESVFCAPSFTEQAQAKLAEVEAHTSGAD